MASKLTRPRTGSPLQWCCCSISCRFGSHGGGGNERLDPRLWFQKMTRLPISKLGLLAKHLLKFNLWYARPLSGHVQLLSCRQEWQLKLWWAKTKDLGIHGWCYKNMRHFGRKILSKKIELSSLDTHHSHRASKLNCATFWAYPALGPFESWSQKVESCDIAGTKSFKMSRGHCLWRQRLQCHWKSRVLAFCCKIVEIQLEADGSFSQIKLRALCLRLKTVYPSFGACRTSLWHTSSPQEWQLECNDGGTQKSERTGPMLRMLFRQLWEPVASLKMASGFIPRVTSTLEASQLFGLRVTRATCKVRVQPMACLLVKRGRTRLGDQIRADLESLSWKPALTMPENHQISGFGTPVLWKSDQPKFAAHSNLQTSQGEKKHHTWHHAEIAASQGQQEPKHNSQTQLSLWWTWFQSHLGLCNAPTSHLQSQPLPLEMRRSLFC